MQYYILKPAVDTPETGHVFPAADSYDDYDFNAPNSMHKLNIKGLPDITPDVRFKLKRGAKLTDMLTQAAISAHGLLISDKLKEFFSEFNIVSHKFYPAKIEAKGLIHDYWWMQLNWYESTQFIDYKNSAFFIRRGLRNIGSIQINSFTEFNEKSKEIGAVNYIDYSKIQFLKPIEYDMFPIYHGIEIFISEKLKSKLPIDITGIYISKTDKISQL